MTPITCTTAPIARRALRPCGLRHRQRGALAILVTVLILMVGWLVAGFTHRTLVFEQRTSANVERSTTAFYAAEAGLNWTLAMLNLPVRTGSACGFDADGPTLRQRYLAFVADGGTIVPRSDPALGPVAQCIHAEAAWSCRCDVEATPTWPVVDDTQAVPSFAIHLHEAHAPGVVEIVSTGCSHAAPPCVDTGQPAADARRQVVARIGLVPALSSGPAAALTVTGQVHAPGASLTVQHIERRSGGLTVHSGGAIHAPDLRATSMPGTPAAHSVREGDAGLAALTPDRLFTRLFGLSRSHYPAQPAVTSVDCRADCTGAAIDAHRRGARILWLPGGAAINGDMELGTEQDPVLLLVDGPLTLRGTMHLHGLLFAHGIQWTSVGNTPSRVNGAVVVAGNFSVEGEVDIHHRAAALEALQRRSGSFARVAGSWRDF